MKALEDYRVAKALTQQELATLLGKSQGQVSHWLRGTRVPSTPNVLLIAEKTGMSLKKLLQEIPK
jgi:transcriptional regulator with XRE-family HTH domain